MKTFITFINIKEVSTPVHYLYNTQSVQCPGAHCTALVLTLNTKQLKCSVQVYNAIESEPSELKHHKNYAYYQKIVVSCPYVTINVQAIRFIKLSNRIELKNRLVSVNRI